MARKIVSTEVFAAPGSSGEYQQIRRTRAGFEARTVWLYTHGPNERSAWEPIDDDEAAPILRRADEPVPPTWRRQAEAAEDRT